MSEHAYKPGTLPALTPYLTVQNAEDAISFYKEAFGFEAADDPMKSENGQVVHAHMKLGDAHIMLGPEGAFDKPNKSPKSLNILPPSGLYVYCSDVDAMYKRALGAGASSLMEPEDSFWGDRICKVTDRDGHEWMFATLIKE
ncbi:MAG: VOC family protein [Alphaproteobacteria bacterium]|jgi:uncharacterized glyoxalase superfamily protein PhnB|nr:VOC family protein [Alphaproteobacteria bacterium]MBT5389647.1 VOC family protein [Alphaproteobacteria bacterium]MBT5540416.1 VOC family protein [Alphaproteobacteria bacterium]MBT5654123.1 VOC family protein [Alphaproteobacteria bacterium]